MIKIRRLYLAASVLAGLCWNASVSGGTIASIDLSGPFQTRSAWQFSASQGPDVEDPTGVEDKVPGPIRLCISKDGGRTCAPDIQNALRLPDGANDDIYAEPHFLFDSRIMHPGPHRALLLLGMASVHAVNGDQRVAMRLLSYDAVRDSFVTVYAHQTGRNNNQEIRYVESGALKGDMIFAEPTGNAPFGYWITVSALSPAEGYRQVLRYRSATRYGDGNALAVIDSEMPNIQQRLGLWRPGAPLPVPRDGCRKPHLVKGALWCD